MAKKTADELFNEAPTADELFASGAGGGGGSEGGAEGGPVGESKPLELPQLEPGTMWDAAKSWANTAVLGAGPQLEGAIAAIAQGAQNLLSTPRPAPVGGTGGGSGTEGGAEGGAVGSSKPLGRAFAPEITPLEAYLGVRDMGREEHAQAENTVAGRMAMLPGGLSTPIPVKGLGPGASVGKKALHGAAVGGVVGGIHGAVNSNVDLFHSDGSATTSDDAREVALDAFFGGLGGAGMGGAFGGAFGALEGPMRSTARKLPMDMLGVSEPARRSMERRGIYDKAGDALLALVRPFRSGMRKGSLTEDALDELGRRGQGLDDVVTGIDQASGNSAALPDVMAEAVRARAKPFKKGGLHQAQIADRMNAEADQLLNALGDKPISLAQAEAFKQNFSQQVAKDLKHAGEPAARTTALAETYRALKGANEQAAEAAAASMAPELAGKFVPAKQAYEVLKAPLAGANIERAGMKSTDFEIGELLANSPMPDSTLSKLTEGLPFAGLVKAPLNLLGRAYGYGAAAKGAEFTANRMAQNTGGGIGGITGASALEQYLGLLEPEQRQQVSSQVFSKATGGR